MLIWIIISLAVVLLDQGTKLLVIHNIAPTDTISVLPRILNLVYVKNTGAAFSILSGKTFFLSLISLAVCVGIVWYLIKNRPENKLMLLSVSLVLGGAVGNLIDRMLRGSVVDFFEVIFVDFPVFNVADIAITVGAVLLMIYVLFFDREKKSSGKEDSDADSKA
mgnify:FL=1